VLGHTKAGGGWIGRRGVGARRNLHGSSLVVPGRTAGVVSYPLVIPGRRGPRSGPARTRNPGVFGAEQVEIPGSRPASAGHAPE
jgi:hypothetical protein